MSFFIYSLNTEWLAPSAHKRFNEVCFLASHNAYANQHDGWRYAQQELNISEQLSYGVRAFLLDIHYYNNEIVLSHGGCRGLYKLLKKGNFDTLDNALNSIALFLDTHPYEVVTIFLENYVPNSILADFLSQHQSRYLFLKPLDWNPHEHDNTWPTFSWMIEHNKRLVIFNEDKSQSRAITLDDPFFSTWHYVIESMYGTTNIKHIIKERKESLVHQHKQRSLYLVNFFGTVTVPSHSTQRNSYKQLEKLTSCIMSQGIKKKPNWIALDFVERGNALAFINELNQKE